MKAGVLLFGMTLLTFGATVEIRQFKRLGDNLHLKLDKHIRNHTNLEFDWKYGKEGKQNIVKVRGYKITFSKSYEKRAELKGNYDLLLKNLQLTDSGTYRATLGDDEKDTTFEYTVIIQANVTPVSLTVTSNSSSGCILNTSCSTEDSAQSVTFICDAEKCSGRSEINALGSIVVFVQQGHIICNHSNKVSWTQDKLDIRAYCGEQSVPSTVSKVGVAVAVTAACIAVCFLLLFLIYFYRKCKILNQDKKVNNYPQETGLKQSRRRKSEEGSPSTTYALVEFSTRPPVDPNSVEEKAETVYSVINKVHTRLPSAGTVESINEKKCEGECDSGEGSLL